MVEVKVCGITSVADAEHAVQHGACAIGLNFWPGTPRRVSIEIAKQVVTVVGDRVDTVGVFVDASVDEIEQVCALTRVRFVQLHGDEGVSVAEALSPRAIKVIGVDPGDTIDDVLRRVEPFARVTGGAVMLDARVRGMMPGGTGHAFDWEIAAEVAARFELTLAGGLTPANVADAVRRVQPKRVDVASGVESAPGVKDADKVQRFIECATHADDVES